jgi:hypothetical protein
LIIKVKETSLPDIRLETLTQKKSGLVRTQRTNGDQTDPGSSVRGFTMKRSGSNESGFL